MPPRGYLVHEIRGRRHRGDLEDLGKIKEVASQEDHVLESFGDELSFDNDEANVMACSLALPDNRQAWQPTILLKRGGDIVSKRLDVHVATQENELFHCGTSQAGVSATACRDVWTYSALMATRRVSCSCMLPPHTVHKTCH